MAKKVIYTSISGLACPAYTLPMAANFLSWGRDDQITYPAFKHNKQKTKIQ